MRLLHAMVFLLLLVGCSTKKNEPDSLPTTLDSILSAHDSFAGVILIAEEGKPVYHRAFGYRDMANRLLNDTSTVFELASVSKQFTSMVILILQDEGKLSFDDPLEKFIPGLPYPGITVRHLLTHTSGLPDYQAVMDEHWDKTKVAGNDDILAYLRQYHPPKRFEPGEKYEYSNTGYVLLGSIAEAASGKDFVALCRERIFKPVGMASADIRTLEEKARVTNFAKGYVWVDEQKRFISADSFPSSNYIVWLGNRKGPGRVSSQAADLLRWDRALYDNTLVRKETLEQAFTPYRLLNDSLSNYGFGWVIEHHPTLGRKIWHTGSNPGYSTRIVRFIDADKTIVVLSNNAYPRIHELDRTLDSLLGTRTKHPVHP
jgi:CubicO group peptidase (beta-lactamase class C family)